MYGYNNNYSGNLIGKSFINIENRSLIYVFIISGVTNC